MKNKDVAGTAVPIAHITQSTLIIRGHKVLLDTDLAAMYGVETGALIQAVKRNQDRFPEDFMLQLTAEEWTALRSQIVISNANEAAVDTHPMLLPSKA